MHLLVVAVALVLPASSPERTAPHATDLAFSELFERATGPLRPSGKLRSLHGRRVRLVGFMARMEDPPDGAFWLVPRPVECDESGGGSGDLPPDAVRVVVRSAAGRPVPFVPGALAVAGVLQLGNAADAEGRVSALRLVLDRADDLRPPGARRSSPRSTTQEVTR